MAAVFQKPFTSAKLQYRTQPIDRRDTVFGRKQFCFSNPVQPLYELTWYSLYLGKLYVAM